VSRQRIEACHRQRRDSPPPPAQGKQAGCANKNKNKKKRKQVEADLGRDGHSERGKELGERAQASRSSVFFFFLFFGATRCTASMDAKRDFSAISEAEDNEESNPKRTKLMETAEDADTAPHTLVAVGHEATHVDGSVVAATGISMEVVDEMVVEEEDPETVEQRKAFSEMVSTAKAEGKNMKQIFSDAGWSALAVRPRPHLHPPPKPHPPLAPFFLSFFFFPFGRTKPYPRFTGFFFGFFLALLGFMQTAKEEFDERHVFGYWLFIKRYF
jgi:hypothetical protein